MSNVKVASLVPQVLKAVTGGADLGMYTTAVRVKAQARALAPVDTAQLKGSIGIKTKDSNNADLTTPVKDKDVLVGTPVEHGIYQEFGTRKMAAQPFLRPAVDIVTGGQNGEQAMKKAMENSVRQVTR